MASTTNAWKLGLFVVVGFTLMVFGGVWLGAQYLQPNTLILTTYFDESVQGLTVGSPVKVRGVPIGSVKTIDLAEDQRLVRVDCEVDSVKLESMGIDVEGSRKEGSLLCGPEVRLTLVNAGITGTKLIQLDFFDPEKFKPIPLGFSPPWNYIPSVPSTLQNIEDGINNVLESMPALLTDAVDSLDRINEIIHEVDVAGLSRQVGEILETIRGKLGSVDTSDFMARIFDFIKKSEETLDDLRTMSSKLARIDYQSFIDDSKRALTQVTEAIEEAKIQETTGSVRRTATVMSSEFVAIGESLRAELESLRETLEAVQALANLLERDPGALIRGKGKDQ